MIGIPIWCIAIPAVSLNRCSLSFFPFVPLYVILCIDFFFASLSLADFGKAVAIFWARVLRLLVAEDACFRMRITMGVVLILSLVFTKSPQGRPRSGSGVALK